MTCENCIHFDICNEQADGNIIELMKEPCFRFKTEQPTWISCAERLPDDCECNNYEAEWAEYPMFLVMIKGGQLPTTLSYDWRKKEWIEIHYDNTTTAYSVTHWMPLPQPPKGDE